jgi:hypothetical protein
LLLYEYKAQLNDFSCGFGDLTARVEESVEEGGKKEEESE